MRRIYSVLFQGGFAISSLDSLPSLLLKINQNQLALEAAIMELTLWVEQRGSGDVADNVRGALAAICSGQLIPDTTLSFSSARAGANPSLN
jgi:hypothetical protein